MDKQFKKEKFDSKWIFIKDVIKAAREYSMREHSIRTREGIARAKRKI